MISVLYK